MSSSNQPPPSKGRGVPRVPQGWREPGWGGGKEPSKRPRPLRSAGELVPRGRKGPARLAAVRAALFWPGPRSAAKVHGGGNWPSPTVAARRHFCPQPRHLPWVLATHPHQSAQFGLGRAFRSRALQRYGRAGPVSSLRVEGRRREAVLHLAAMSCPLRSGEREETEFLGRMRRFRQVSPVTVFDSLSSLSAGGGKGPALPLPPSLSTPAVWQGRGRCRRGSVAKSERAWLVGVFIFADSE